MYDASIAEPHGKDEIFDVAFQIQCLEKEAYCSVLRAFIAQSDLLSWVCFFVSHPGYVLGFLIFSSLAFTMFHLLPLSFYIII